MSNVVFDQWLVDALASAVRVVDQPTAPYGWGVDLSCTTDVAADFAELSPNSSRSIGEAIIRRWITEQGQLLRISSDGNIVAADYGAGLPSVLNRGVDPATLAGIEDVLTSEALADDRVAGIEVTVSWDASTSSLTVAATVQPHGSDQTFDLIVGLDAVGQVYQAAVGEV